MNARSPEQAANELVMSHVSDALFNAEGAAATAGRALAAATDADDITAVHALVIFQSEVRAARKRLMQATYFRAEGSS